VIQKGGSEGRLKGGLEGQLKGGSEGQLKGGLKGRSPLQMCRSELATGANRLESISAGIRDWHDLMT